MAIHRRARLWRGRAAAGQTLTLPAPPNPFGWMQIIAGDVRLELGAEGALAGGEGLVLTRGDGVGFTAQQMTGPAAEPLITTLTAGAAGADLLWFALA